MKMVRMIVSLPEPFKAKLDALRAQGYTASGFIRSVLERELKHAPATGQKGPMTHGTKGASGSGIAQSGQCSREARLVRPTVA